MRFIVLLLFYCPFVDAHVINESYLDITPVAKGFKITWEAEAFLYEKDLALDNDGNELISFDDLYANKQKLIDFSFKKIRFYSADKPCTLTKPKFTVFPKDIDTYTRYQFFALCNSNKFDLLSIRYQLFFDKSDNHQVFITINGTKKSVLVVNKDNANRLISVSTQSNKSTFLKFIYQGIEHIWQGLDHLLYVFVLLFPLLINWFSKDDTRFARLLTVITMFTVAHSITLALSLFKMVNFPPTIIEPLILFSILLTGLNNVFNIIKTRWYGAFVFGLLHGFGFAYILMDLKLPTSALATALLGFNLGIEIGQIVFIVALIPLGFVVSRFAKKTQHLLIKIISLIFALLTINFLRLLLFAS